MEQQLQDRKEYKRSYYQKNRERLLRRAREYHYKHRERYNAYSKQYWQDHKDSIVRKRKGTETSRLRANLSRPNKDPVLEERRKTFEDIRLTPPSSDPIPEPQVDRLCLVIERQSSTKPFIVSFD